MAELYEQLKPKSKYYDRANYSSQEEYDKKLLDTCTVYVGNLSFYTSQDSINELFSRCGQVKDIKMGINDDGHPAGFCFVIFNSHEEAQLAVEYISQTKLWERIIRVDWDPGYKQGRQKGRGSGGQQKRDEFRTKEDADRPVKHGTPAKKFNRDQNHSREGRYDRAERGGYNNYRGGYRDYNGGGGSRDFNRDRDYRRDREYPRESRQQREAQPEKEKQEEQDY